MITAAILVLIWVTKKHFYIQRSGLFNPFKNIYRVLKYSWKHKVPEHRSAFTYWEEDIPPRIDLGKDKYGGPFTTEEVENSKTFLRILPLLLCLFGYHLAGDGYSAPEQLLTTMQLSFTNSTAAGCTQSAPHKCSCHGGRYQQMCTSCSQVMHKRNQTGNSCALHKKMQCTVSTGASKDSFKP